MCCRNVATNKWKVYNNSKLGDFVDLISPIVLEIKDTTVKAKSALSLDIHLEIDSEGRLGTKLYW